MSFRHSRGFQRLSLAALWIATATTAANVGYVYWGLSNKKFGTREERFEKFEDSVSDFFTSMKEFSEKYFPVQTAAASADGARRPTKSNDAVAADEKSA